jgi:hypothetical protein
VGGGVSTIRRYLRAGLIDELHLAIRPVLRGSGEHLLSGIDMRALGYEGVRYVAGERATTCSCADGRDASRGCGRPPRKREPPGASESARRAPGYPSTIRGARRASRPASASETSA